VSPVDRCEPGGADRQRRLFLDDVRTAKEKLSISTRAYFAELPSLIDEITNGGLAIATRTIPLADIEAAWMLPETPGLRTVLAS
jgi:hypothetical protein